MIVRGEIPSGFHTLLHPINHWISAGRLASAHYWHSVRTSDGDLDDMDCQTCLETIFFLPGYNCASHRRRRKHTA